MTNLEEIGLTTQSFRSAGGLEVYPNLVIDSPIRVETRGKIEEAFACSNLRLRQEASKKGNIHVFGIRYKFKEFSGLNSSQGILVSIGTGYKSK